MVDGIRSSTALRGVDVLASRPFLLSIVVLALNDHVLKAAWPGLITGKLSDVAGVMMIAILLTATTRHPSVAFSFTVAAFGCLKTIPVVAEWAAPMLGGVTRTDPTDLLALVALLPLWRWMRRRQAMSAGVVGPPRLRLKIVAVSAAVLAMTATSCDEQGLTGFSIDSNGVIVADGHESIDGGRTWTATERSGAAELSDGSCVADGTCYEIDGHGVTAIDDTGAREVILFVENGFVSELPDIQGSTCNVGVWQSVSAVDLDDGRHVIVAMGEHGALHQGPNGRWEWVAVGASGMPSSAAGSEPFGIPVSSTIDDGIAWGLWVGRLVLLLIPAVVLALARPMGSVAQRHGRSRSAASRAVVAVAAVALLVATGILVVSGSDLFGLFILLTGIMGLAVLAGAAVLALLIVYGRPRSRARRSSMPPPSPRDRVG